MFGFKNKRLDTIQRIKEKQSRERIRRINLFIKKQKMLGRTIFDDSSSVFDDTSSIFDDGSSVFDDTASNITPINTTHTGLIKQNTFHTLMSKMGLDRSISEQSVHNLSPFKKYMLYLYNKHNNANSDKDKDKDNNEKKISPFKMYIKRLITKHKAEL